MVSDFLLGISFGIVISMLTGIWIESFYRWYDKHDPWRNKHLGKQVIIITIIVWSLLIWIMYLGFTYNPL
jgi:hypothetical protein